MFLELYKDNTDEGQIIHLLDRDSNEKCWYWDELLCHYVVFEVEDLILLQGWIPKLSTSYIWCQVFTHWLVQYMCFLYVVILVVLLLFCFKQGIIWN